MPLGHDLPTSVNDRVISPFPEFVFSFAKFPENKTLAKNSEFKDWISHNINFKSIHLYQVVKYRKYESMSTTFSTRFYIWPRGYKI